MINNPTSQEEPSDEWYLSQIKPDCCGWQVGASVHDGVLFCRLVRFDWILGGQYPSVEVQHSLEDPWSFFADKLKRALALMEEARPKNGESP